MTFNVIVQVAFALEHIVMTFTAKNEHGDENDLINGSICCRCREIFGSSLR